MKIVMACFVGWLLSVGAGAEPVVAGQVRLAAGEPAAGAQVLLFDLGNLRRGAIAQATTDAAGAFVLSLGMRPAGFELGQNYPNPFNPSTIIPYELAAAARVRLEVFNTLGQRMATLVDGEQPAGAHRARWNGTDAAGRAVAAGVYLYRLTVDGTSQTGRMVLVDGQAGFDRTSASSVESLSPRGDASSLRAELVEARPVEAVGSSYGLVVLGEGLETYVDADFRIEAAIEPVVLEAHQAGRGKAAQTLIGILGDVDNTREVNLADALLVIAYSLDPSIAIPNNGSIWLGDVNGDGRIDGADAQLIEQYSRNGSSSLGIGRRLMLRPVPARVVGRLGDVDNNRRVNLADALLVTAYSLDPSIEMPDGGTIWLGDINGDNRIDGADAQLIEQYSRNPNASDLPDDIGEWVTIRPIIGPIEPPIVEPPVEPPVAGLLAIPPLTLTEGSFYIQYIKDASSPVAGDYYAEALSSDPTVAVAQVRLVSRDTDDGKASEQWGAVVIGGVALGTAQVTVKSTFGDPQTIPVTVVERPPSIDSVPSRNPRTEEVTLVFYNTPDFLDKNPWYRPDRWLFRWKTIDHLLEFFGFSSTEAETKSTEITWVDYAHDDGITYSLSKQSVELYEAQSGLREEAFVVLQDAKQNVLQDVVLALAPGLLFWPATAISIIGDLQMYTAMIEVYLAGKLKSTKAELHGLLAADGSIIEGNSYMPLLMMKNDEEDQAAVEVRLHVTRAMDIASEGKQVRTTHSTDLGPLTVPAETGYQILSNQSLVFADEVGKDLTQVEVALNSGLYDQTKRYRVRDKGPALAVEEGWTVDDDTPQGEFTLWATVLNRSEKYPASSPTHLRYYCSADPVIDPSDDFLLKDITKGEDFITLKEFPAVELARLDALGETQQGIRLPAPRARFETGDVFLGMCWGPNPAFFKTIYYGACVWDEVEEEYNACSPGTPVQTGTLD